MASKDIATVEQYRAALDRIAEILDSEDSASEMAELAALAEAVERYDGQGERGR